MDLFTQLKNTYPELTAVDFAPNGGTISLQDDGDGVAYIAKWNYSKPLPAGSKLGK